MEYDLATIKENIKLILMEYPNQPFKIKQLRTVYQETYNESLRRPPGSSLTPTAFFASLNISDVTVDSELKTITFYPKTLNVQGMILTSSKMIEKYADSKLGKQERNVKQNIADFRIKFDKLYGETLETFAGKDDKISWAKREMSEALKIILEKYDLGKKT